MIIQIKKCSNEEYIFRGEDDSDFLYYSELVSELTKLLDKLPLYLNPDKKSDWTLFVTDCDLSKKYNFSYEVYGITDFDTKCIYINNTKNGVYFALPHEIGHMVDKMLSDISQTESWQQIFNSYKKKYKDSDLFERMGLVKECLNAREFFAEVFRVYLSDSLDLFDDYDESYYFRDLFGYMKKCVDLLFLKTVENVKYYEEEHIVKEYHTVFDDDCIIV